MAISWHGLGLLPTLWQKYSLLTSKGLLNQKHANLQSTKDVLTSPSDSNYFPPSDVSNIKSLCYMTQIISLKLLTDKVYTNLMGRFLD